MAELELKEKEEWKAQEEEEQRVKRMVTRANKNGM